MAMGVDPSRAQFSPPLHVNDDHKGQLLRNSVASIWISRLLKMSALFFAAHLILLSLILFYTKVRTACTVEWGSDTGNEMQVENMVRSPTEVVNVVRYIVSNLFTKWVLLIGFVCIAQSFVLGLFAEDEKKVTVNKWDWILHLCGGTFPQAIVGSLATGALNGYLAHCYMNLVGVPMLSEEKTKGLEECTSYVGPSSICWNSQYKLIIFVTVVWAGVSFYSQYYRRNFVLHFPVVDLRRRDHIRNAALESLSASCKRVCEYMVVIYVFYVIHSTIFFVHYFFTAETSKSLGIFFNVPLIYNILVWPSVTYFSRKLCWALVEVALTEKLNFPIESRFPASNVIVLSDVMTSGPTHMKYLAYLEFNMIACTPKSPAVIQQFFHLSHPGGHPRNWTRVLKAVLTDTNNFVRQLKKFIVWQKTLRIPPPRHPNTPALSAELLDPPLLWNPNTLRRRTVAQTQMRDLTTLPPDAAKAEGRTRSEFIRTFLGWLTPHVLHANVKHFWQSTLDSKIRPRIYRFKFVYTAKDQLHVLANVLSSTQLVTWGVNGIVEVSCYSLDFDNRGVVQRDLHKVVSCLLDLHAILDSLCDLDIPWGPNAMDEDARGTYLQLRDFHTCVLYSLAKIHHHFSNYYEYLRIPVEQQHLIKQASESQPPTPRPAYNHVYRTM